MGKFLLTLPMLLVAYNLNAEFKDTREFNQRPSTVEHPNYQERELRDQAETYRSLPEDEANYYRETRMPAPNQGENYLLHEHNLQEAPLQQNPDY